MAIMLASFSIMSLYAETILQIYIIVTSHTTMDSPIAATSLSMTLLAFIVTSTTSVVLVLKSSDFLDKTKAKVLFGSLHLFCIGLLWRIFKLILCFSEKELKQLTIIRLVHVVLQSAPYVVLYSRFFVMGGRINIIQILSLLTSVMSSALTLTSYNLRHKASEDCWEEKISRSSLKKMYVSIGVTLTGTVLVLSTRFASLSLMSVQKGWWLVLPLAVHFVTLLLIFIISKRKSPFQFSLKRLPLTVFYCSGMSLLNTLELVYDNIDRVMCKYVAFYSLFLVENIVLLSVWLLGSDLNYVSKLIVVVGILTAFICGLIAKFAGCTLIQKIDRETNDSSMPSTIATTPSVSTATPSVLNTREVSQITTDDEDLISIIQASLFMKSQNHSVTASKTISPNSRCRVLPPFSSPQTLRIHTSLKKDEEHENVQVHTLQQVTPRSKVSSRTSTQRTQTSVILTESSVTYTDRENPQRKVKDFHTSQSSLAGSSDTGTLTIKSDEYFSSSHSQCFYRHKDNLPVVAYSKYRYSEPCTSQEITDAIEMTTMETTSKNTRLKYLDYNIENDNEKVRKKSRGLFKRGPEFLPAESMLKEFNAPPNPGSRHREAVPTICDNLDKETNIMNSSYPTSSGDPTMPEKSKRCAELRSHQISYCIPSVTGHDEDLNFKTDKERPKKKMFGFSSKRRTLDNDRFDNITQIRAQTQSSQRQLDEGPFQIQTTKCVLSPGQLQLDQTESSFMSTTMTQYTTESDTTLTSTEMTSQTSWQERLWSIPGGTLKRKLRHPLPDDRSNATSSANILKWLADTEQCQHEWTTQKPIDDT